MTQALRPSHPSVPLPLTAALMTPDVGPRARVTTSVTLTLPLVLSAAQAEMARHIRAVSLAFQHELAGGMQGRQAFKVAGVRARQHGVPETYLNHVARAAQLMRREGQPVTPWTRLTLITGNPHVRVIDPLRVEIAGLGEVRGELFRLLSLDPRVVPRPDPGLPALHADVHRLDREARARPGWPGETPPRIQKAVLCPGPGGWRLVVDVRVPDLALTPRLHRFRAGIDVGVSPLAVLVTSSGRTEELTLDGLTVTELRRTETLRRAHLLGQGHAPNAVRAALLPWRQALYLRGLTALTPLLESLPGLSHLSTEGLDLSCPRDDVERRIAQFSRPYALPDVLTCLPAWCQQSGTTLRAVDRSYSSRTCPRCQSPVTPGRAHSSCPACGHTGNRHAWAAEILMQRGARP